MTFSIIDFSHPPPSNIQDKLNWLSECKANSCVMLEMNSSEVLAWFIVQCFEKNVTIVPVDPRLDDHQKNNIFNLVQPSFWVKGADAAVQKYTEFRSDYEDTSFILFTSGSTSTPKGVMLSKQAILHNSTITAKEHGFDSNQLHATCMPLLHCNSIAMSLLGHYINHAKFILFSNASPKEILSESSKFKVQTISVSPAILTEILHCDISHLDFSSLKYFISASAPLSSHQCEIFYQKFGPKLRQGYGLSEAVNFSFLMPLLDDENFKLQYIKQHPPVGIPLVDTEFKLINNEVYVKSQGIMSGYLDNPIETNKVFNDQKFLATGDIGYIRDGYLVLNGRFKEIINRGGETIYPSDVERSLASKIPECKEIACYGVLNDKMDTVIGANIKLVDEANILDVFEKLDNHRPPIETVRFEAVTRTTTLKPQRTLMSNRMVSIPSSEIKYKLLQEYAYKIYKEILLNKPAEDLVQLSYIFKQAYEFVDSYESDPLVSFEEIIHTDVTKSLNLLAEYWPYFINGNKKPIDLIKDNKGLWESLMTGYPMGQYAILTSKFLIKNNLLNGKCLEIGAGVGNTTRLIADYVNNEFIRTDLIPELVNKIKCKGTISPYDFNKKGPWRNLDTIFGVNALHCADNKLITLQNLKEMLKPGGILVLGEGAPYPKNNTPWCLNGFYGLFNGWWDKGGFISRKEWISLLNTAGFEKIGFSQLRAGKFDLGGIIWGQRPIL